VPVRHPAHAEEGRSGPAVGTQVVSTGAAMLYRAEILGK
jgi:hypothetical protein